MKVLNIHTRVILQPKARVAELFKTLASDNDKMLATDKWPGMRLDKGLTVGSKGGHGPIRYTVEDYREGDSIQFRFLKPRGFHGFHGFEVKELSHQQTEIKHIIDMNISGPALLTWPLAVRWLHDALIEDAFDKVENQFIASQKRTEWSRWVKFLRGVLSWFSKSHR